MDEVEKDLVIVNLNLFDDFDVVELNLFGDFDLEEFIIEIVLFRKIEDFFYNNSYNFFKEV